MLLLAYGSAASRRLTIADYVLTGMASGLGFAIIEGNFFTVLEAKYSPDWFAWFGVPGNLTFEGQTSWTAGHVLWSGFIALGIGIGIRLWPKDARKFLPAAAAATLALFEHVMVNWKGVHTEYLFGQIESIARAPDWVELLHSIDLHGFMTILLLPTLLLAATVMEGYWSRELYPGALMLPDEGLRPLTLREWLVLARIIPRGRTEFFRTMAYFRRRRELSLARAEARRPSGGTAVEPVAAYLCERVVHLREELNVPMPARWLPAPGEFLAASRAMVRGNGIVLAGFALFAVMLMLPPGIWPEWFRAFLFGRVFHAILLLLAALLLVSRMRAFRRHTRPDARRSDDEVLATWNLRALLLGSSAFSLAYATLAAFLPADVLSGGTVFISNAFDNWLAHGGGPTTLAVGGLLASALADPADTDPCAELRREADFADARIKELEKLAGNWTPPQPPPGGWPLDRQPTNPSTSGMSTDSIFGRALDALANTGAGKKFTTICQPILGPSGQIIGYAMGQAPAPDSGTGTSGGLSAGSGGAGASAALGGLPVNNAGTPGAGTICQPIFGPNGQIIGYAMGQGGGSTAIPTGDMPAGSGGTGNPGTIDLPGGRRLHVDPFEEWLTGKSTAQQALDDEREAQKQRLAALVDCDQMKAPQTKEKDATAPPPLTHPDFATLQKEIDDAKKQFEELEKQLRAAAAKDLDAIDSFMKDYDSKWKPAVDALNRYLQRYQDLIPDYQKILEQFAGRQQALKYAAFADEAYRDIASILGPELLPGGALAANEANVAAQAEAAAARAEAEAAARAEAAAAKAEADAAAQAEAAAAKSEADIAAAQAKAEADAAARAQAQAASPSASTNFINSNGQVSNQPLLQPGQAGRDQLARLMDGYTAPQNSVYEGSVNRYAQEMIDGTFDWSKIPDGSASCSMEP